MYINSVADLDRLGLRDLSYFHPELALRFGNVHLGVLAKYPDGEGIWRRCTQKSHDWLATSSPMSL